MQFENFSVSLLNTMVVAAGAKRENLYDLLKNHHANVLYIAYSLQAHQAWFWYCLLRSHCTRELCRRLPYFLEPACEDAALLWVSHVLWKQKLGDSNSRSTIDRQEGR